MQKIFVYKLGEFPEQLGSLDLIDETPSFWLQNKAYEGLSGKHSIEFEIVGKAAKKLFRLLKRGCRNPVEIYDQNYRNLSMKKKIEFKQLQKWTFKYTAKETHEAFFKQNS